MIRRAVLLAALLAAACRPSPGGTAAPPGTPPSTAAAVPASAAPAFVTAASPVRREASDAAKVKGPDGKDVQNLVAFLHRGEQVTVVETREDWVRIRTSDDREGWLKSGAVMQGDGLAPATVLVPADVFDRPDLLAANAKRKLDPGTLLLVVKAKPPFTEVNVSGTGNAWVLSERLATGDREVQVAKLVEKARWLERYKKHDEALQVLALAREHFADVPLVDLLATELGEAAPAQAAGTPPAGAAPQR